MTLRNHEFNRTERGNYHGFYRPKIITHLEDGLESEFLLSLFLTTLVQPIGGKYNKVICILFLRSRGDSLSMLKDVNSCTHFKIPKETS